MTTESEIQSITPYSKIVDYEKSCEIVRSVQGVGLEVVLTTGVYDLFHYKHAESLACISLLGNFTIVGIPGDLEVSNAASQGIQSKDSNGPVIDFEKRAKMVSHLTYVDLIFKKATSKLDLITNIQPDILAQSITSGYHVINEVLELKKYFESETKDDNLILCLPYRNCEIIFLDDVVNGYTSIVKSTDALKKSKLWEESRFSDDKFHGSAIKKEIIRRALINK